MRIRSWRGTTAVASSTPGRRFPWARVVLSVAIIAAVAYLLVPGYYFVSADALVQGDLVPVTPIYRARIDRLLVQCDDLVHTGEKVAVVSNFLVQASYEQQYQQSVSQLGLSQIALDQGGNAARTEEASDLAKYQAATVDARRLHDLFTNYDAAYRSGAIPRVDWESKRQEWQSAESIAEGARQVWLHASEHVDRVDADNASRVSADRTDATRVAQLAKRVSAEALTAPVSGYVMNCKERPQNVVDAGAPLFDIFAPERAYVLAYFNPADIDRVHIGDRAEVLIAGSNRAVDGRVLSVYPNLSKLPAQLTRFFWQHVQWSEYRPVRIALDRVPANVRQQLYYDAQTRVRIRIPRDWHPFGLFDSTGNP